MNKFLKKSLSIALAVAMLMTVCAVSFGASAAVGSSVNWDFTGDNAAANLTELKDNATFFGTAAGGYAESFQLKSETTLLGSTKSADGELVRLTMSSPSDANVNGFVLDGVVPTYLHTVVGENGSNAVGNTRATNGLVFAKDDLGGYFMWLPVAHSKKVKFAVKYIMKNSEGTYNYTSANAHLMDDLDPTVAKLVYENGDTEEPEGLTSSELTMVNDVVQQRLKYDITAKFDGKKVTITTTVLNNGKSLNIYSYNGKSLKSVTFKDVVIDLNDPSTLASAQGSKKNFADTYKERTGKTYDVANIDAAAGISIASQDSVGKKGSIYSFAGEFDGACTHPTVEKRNVKEATCLINGSYDEYCTVCGKYVRTVTTTGTHDDKCACLKLFPSVVITDGVIGVSLKAGMAVIPSGTNNSWEMEMKIHGVDADWVRASQTSQSLGTGLEGLADNQQGADQLVDGVYYFSKVYPGKTIDPVTGEETTEEDNSNAVHMTDITKFYDQMTQEITVDVRYAPIYVGGTTIPSGKAQGDYIFGEGSYDSANAYPFEESHARSKTFKFTIADLLKGVYENENNSEKLRSLAVKTANYGAAAQDYFQYENNYSGNRANDWVKDASLKTVDDNAYAGVKDVAKVENKKEGVKVAATVQLKNKLGIAVSINQNDAKAYLVDGDKETKLTTEAAKQGDEIVGTKAAYFGITATQMANGYTIRFKDSDGNTLADVTYSVNSYIARQGKKETTSAALKTLVNAMAEFYTAAVKVVEA